MLNTQPHPFCQMVMPQFRCWGILTQIMPGWLKARTFSCVIIQSCHCKMAGHDRILSLIPGAAMSRYQLSLPATMLNLVCCIYDVWAAQGCCCIYHGVLYYYFVRQVSLNRPHKSRKTDIMLWSFYRKGFVTFCRKINKKTFGDWSAN